MAAPERNNAKYPRLSRWAQGGAIFAGTVMLVAAAYLYFHPPIRVSNETSIHSQPTNSEAKRSDQPSDPTTVVIGMLTAGMVALIFGLNGFRMTKFSSPIGDAETHTEGEKGAEKQAIPETPAPNIPPAAPAVAADEILNAKREVLVQMMRYFLGASSWNGLKICYACQLAFGTPTRQFNLRNLCLLDARMGFDYAFGCLVATSSTGLFLHQSDPTNTVITVTEFTPTVANELAAEIQRRLAADIGDAPTKQAELAMIRTFFGVAQ